MSKESKPAKIWTKFEVKGTLRGHQANLIQTTSWEHLQCSHLQQNSSKMKWGRCWGITLNLQHVWQWWVCFHSDIKSTVPSWCILQKTISQLAKSNFVTKSPCHTKTYFGSRIFPFLCVNDSPSQNWGSHEGLDSKCSRTFWACWSDGVYATSRLRGHVISNSCKGL